MIGIDSRNTTDKAYKIFKGLIILLVIVAIGSVGYMKIEGWSLFDSLYMTVITITTVGFGEIRDVSVAGRLFTILLIFSGMGIIAYIVGLTAQGMIELQIRTIIGRRKLDLQIKKIKDHYIICGFGRIGI
ncbi:ion channel [Thermodesulfobacteriota bacterium]